MAYKTYVGIVRDHSGSMSGIARYAARDFNNIVTSLKEASAEENIDTIVSTVECGRGRNGEVRRDVVNSNVNVLQPIPENGYITDGGSTPLWDATNEIINILESVPDAYDPEVNFVVMVITDGEENRSRTDSRSLAVRLRQLTGTDRWTFTFRVPKGYGRKMANSLQLSDGNILEWDGRSGASMEASTVATTAAVRSMYSARKTGVKATKTFYTNLAQVSAEEVKAVLVDVSEQVSFFPVEPKFHDSEIDDFMFQKTGKPLVKGEAFYQLTKTESRVQDYKQIAVRDKSTGAVYTGAAARQLLGLPQFGDVRLVPTSSGKFDVFIQSTSLNRKLKEGTKVLYWPGATINK